jgi:TatD DNase family protein
VVTYKNSNLRLVLEKTDLKNIVLESDAPYLTPEPKRGKRNESSYLVYTAQKVAEVYGLPIKELAEITTSNARNLFGI